MESTEISACWGWNIPIYGIGTGIAVCWAGEGGRALCSSAGSQASGAFSLGQGRGLQVHSRACWLSWEWSERKGGSKSKFGEINHFSAKGNVDSGSVGVLKCTEMHRSKIKARFHHLLHCMLKTGESAYSHWIVPVHASWRCGAVYEA